MMHRSGGRRVIRNFNFQAKGTQRALIFRDCDFKKIPDLRQMHLFDCMFINCTMPGLNAENLSCDNNFILEDCTITGQVNLSDSEINGSLFLNDTKFHAPEEHFALIADRLKLTGSLSARRIIANGEARAAGMQVGGNVNFSGATLINENGYAFNGSGISVGGNLVCETDSNTGEMFRSTGLLYISGATIENHFLLRGAQLTHGRNDFANYSRADPLYDPLASAVLDRAKIYGSIRADADFNSKGTIRAKNVFIGDSILFRGATITLPTNGDKEYRALHLDGSEIKTSLDLSKTQITGQLRMVDLKVHGQVLLNDSERHFPEQDVIKARHLSTGLNFDCKRAKIQGSIEMPDCLIGANLNFRGATISHPGKHIDDTPKSALNIRHSHIERDLLCTGERPQTDTKLPFTITGSLSMRRAKVEREVNFTGANFNDPDGILEADDVTTHVFLLLPSTEPRCRITLRSTTCSIFESNDELWNGTANIDLTDFHYGQLKPPAKADTIRKRERQFKKISTESSFQPSAYDQLATALRANGDDEQVRLVLFEKQRERYKAAAKTAKGPTKPFITIWSFWQRILVGYGYRPTYALIWLASLLLLGTVIFQHGYDQNPLPQQIVGDQYHGDSGRHHFIPINEQDHPSWNPFLFTADLLVPIIDFGNKSRWLLPSPYQWIAALFIAMGWILASSVTAGITRLVRKD
jgi:hypothetical protein